MMASFINHQKHKPLASIHSLKKLCSDLLRAGRLICGAAPGWMLAWALLLVLQGLLPVATIYVTRLLVNELVGYMATRAALTGLQPIIILSALLGGLLLLNECINGANDWVRSAFAEIIEDYLNGLVQAKASSLDLSFYEDADYYDHLYRVMVESVHRPLALLDSAGSLLQNGMTLVGMGGLLLLYGSWLPLMLFLGMLPALYVVITFGWRYHQWWKRTTQDRRWSQYYNYMLTDNIPAAELRLFDLGKHFQDAFQAVRQRLRGERLALIKQQGLADLGASLVALLITAGVIARLGWRVLQGALTLGDLTLFYQAFSRSQAVTRVLLGNLGQIYANSLFLQNLFEFLDLETRIKDPSAPLRLSAPLKTGIRFRQVTFRYPGSDQPALENFNLFIPAGKVVAIMGQNGSGKTTLVKLLCRFYDPEAGTVQLDGIDLRDLAMKDLSRLITVLFQDPFPYHATAGQNIAMGDLSRNLGVWEVEKAAYSAGAHDFIQRLSSQYETLLGKYFVNGTELSQGEWQRIALARAYARQAEIIVLDEPTSFMDSWSEADWFDRLRELAAGRTVILITHRFTIAQRADIIHVMDRGQVIESGSHSELLALGGRYAQSWAVQIQPEAIPA